MAALKKMSVPRVRVRRDGNVGEVSAKELVPGEVGPLSDLLRSIRDQCPNKEDFSVVIRGDKDLAFSEIEPVIAAATSVGITKMRLTALVPEPK